MFKTGQVNIERQKKSLSLLYFNIFYQLLVFIIRLFLFLIIEFK
jgi:hypothetical protein